MNTIKAKLVVVENNSVTKLYLVDKNDIGENDLCLFVIEDEDTKEITMIIGCPDDLLGSPIKEVYRVIGDQKEIGLKYVKNKLGTHGVDDFYVTDMTNEDIEIIIKNGGDCEIESDEIPDLQSWKEETRKCDLVIVPTIKDGKVIFVL